MALRRWFALTALITTLTWCTTGNILSANPQYSKKSVSADAEGFLKQYAKTRRFSAGQPTKIRVLPDSSAVLFLRSGARSFDQKLYEFDVRTGQEHLLLSSKSLLHGVDEHLSQAELARRERMRLSARGITSYRISKEGHRILVPLSSRLFVIDRVDNETDSQHVSQVKVRELISDRGFPIDPQFSPDAKKVACVRHGELFVIDIESGREIQLTSGAGGSITHGLAEFVAQEEMGRFHGFWWSPNSQRIVYQRNDTAALETMHILDATHPERAPSTWPYPRPGKANVDVTLGIVNAAGGDTTWVDWDHESFPYLATVRWSENAPLTMVVQNREQTEEHLLAVDPTTGDTTTLLVEKDVAWINLDQSMPNWLEDGSGFFWTTERNGWWQLELRSFDGELLRALTPTSFGFQGFIGYDNDRHVAYLRGSSDPTQTQLYSLTWSKEDASTIKPLTHTPGIHNGIFSKDHRVFVTCSPKTGPVVMRVSRPLQAP